MLDPGHGGLDSGAFRDDVKESDLMLTFSFELAETLIRTGRVEVRLTRYDDEFLRISERLEAARNAGATALISLHADALEEGRASGAAAFTLSKSASDETAAALVESHERADVLVGGALSQTDDEIATILLDMSQRVSHPASQALAQDLITALSQAENSVRRKAQQSANFGVLKSPDIASVLLELGFMSDENDLKNLQDEAWRRHTANAISSAVLTWLDRAGRYSTE